jgi:hypothetical protein
MLAAAATAAHGLIHLHGHGDEWLHVDLGGIHLSLDGPRAPLRVEEEEDKTNDQNVRGNRESARERIPLYGHRICDRNGLGSQIQRREFFGEKDVLNASAKGFPNRLLLGWILDFYRRRGEFKRR